MIELARRAALAAGDIMREAPVRGVRHKGAVDLVTEVDLACEAAIRDILSAAAPDIPILGEESADLSAPVPATCWIVDPLDGTTNFVHGFPAYGVSIALRVDGRLELGCVYDPSRRELFTAVRDGGARCNDEPIRVSGVAALDDSLLVSGFPYDRRERAAFYLSFFQAFMERAQGLRRVGAAALDLCWLAAGRVDGFWEFGLKPWDIAAGALIIREAGGRVTDLSGGVLELSGARILATNGHIHQRMIETIAGVLAANGGRISDQHRREA
jgi:myo-inositol-1(or 4)-monophosphatase